MSRPTAIGAVGTCSVPMSPIPGGADDGQDATGNQQSVLARGEMSGDERELDTEDQDGCVQVSGRDQGPQQATRDEQKADRSARTMRSVAILISVIGYVIGSAPGTPSGIRSTSLRPVPHVPARVVSSEGRAGYIELRLLR